MAANDIMKLPSDIISKILVRLESLELLVRCKLVCREWREVLRSREFILTHYAESSSKPFSFLVHHLDTLTGEHTITIHNHAMDNLDYTAPNVFPETAVVGIVKGVVCLCSLQLGNQVMLWNPFLTQFLEIPHPVENEPIEEDRCVSIGVGCEGITVFVIRISHSSVSTPLRVQVFNTNSFVWEVIENDISIGGFISPYCDTVVKGCPCWVIMGEDRKITQFHLGSRSMILLTFPDIGPSNYLMFELRDKLSILSWNTGELELTIWQYNDINLGRTHFTKFKVPRGLHRINDIVGEKEIVGEAEEGNCILFKLGDDDPDNDNVLNGLFIVDGYVKRCLKFWSSMVPIGVEGEDIDEGNFGVLKSMILPSLVIAAGVGISLFALKRLRG